MSLRLAIPSKGRLQSQCIDWFAARGLTITRPGNAREYAGRIEGVDGVELQLLPASEIVRELAAGRVHLGVTGQDLVREALPDWNAVLQERAGLGFGRADLVLAVPAIWIDVLSVEDLDEVAAAFRQAHAAPLRVATKYRRLVHSFLRRHGVADYRIVESHGATEGTVKNRSAELIADITSTGETLRANHLKTLQDGLILASQAALFSPRSVPEPERPALDALCARLGLAAFTG
ncbi:MAG: ATP phosphoribosyltransferase [Pseudomonadota bacterium]